MSSSPERQTQLHPLDGQRPVLTAIVDLARPLADLAGDPVCTFARCLVVIQGTPLAWLDVDLTDGTARAEAVAERVWATLRRDIVRNLAARGLSAPGSLPLSGFDLGPEPDRCVHEDATVVIATRERPELLESCIRSIQAGAIVPASIVVVDNAPVTDDTRDRVHALAAVDPTIAYHREMRPGLGRAHNAALPLVGTRVVAFTDDDVVVDRWWLARIVEAFDAGDDVACVTGMIAPLELETETQQLIEAYAGFNKGFERRLFDPAADHREDVLFPFAAGVFGSGANMAFDTAYLRSVGGFDDALGAGTIALGGDDLAAFYDVMATGHQLVYEPAAVVSHRHHREPDALRRQAYGYGAGLSAHLTRCVLNDPRTLWRMLRRVPPALRRVVSIARPETAANAPAPPKTLTAQHLRGMASGPVRYLRSRRALRAGATPIEAVAPAP